MSDEIIKSIYVNADSGITIAADNCKDNGFITSDKWINSPDDSLIGAAILFVHQYSDFWVVQKFHFITEGQSAFEYQRMYVTGSKWTAWKRIEYK